MLRLIIEALCDKGMTIKGRYISLVALASLIYFVGNIIYGAVALIFIVCFIGLSFVQAKHLKLSGRRPEFVLVLLSVAALLISSMLPIWGRHPSIGSNENGVPHQPHAHYLWQVNHVH